ncbi:ankyrin repeat-containing domain protein [Penicillium sp. IBT 16267x]|nr:ankyrin repeat-containing domain protein [Penicillium sp. IBT 16267x]
MTPLGDDGDGLRLLIEKGMDVNMSLENGKYGSALAATAVVPLAPLRPLVENLQCLMEAVTDMNQSMVETYGSALTAAAYFRRTEPVEVLVNAGANVGLELENVHFVTALQAAKIPLLREDYFAVGYRAGESKIVKACS